MASLIPSIRTRAAGVAAWSTRITARSLSTSSQYRRPAGTPTEAIESQAASLQETVAEEEKQPVQQAPNRAKTWSRSQMPRELAMTGPRFEQTIVEYQPQPWAAIELVHKQPVRWVDERSVACDGGGGPLGHPRIYINLDKPQVCWCTYCGTPYANTHHKKHLESLQSTSYPLTPTGDPAQVELPSTASQKGHVEGH